MNEKKHVNALKTIVIRHGINKDSIKQENDPNLILYWYWDQITTNPSLDERRKLAESVLYFMEKFRVSADNDFFQDILKAIKSPIKDRIRKKIEKWKGSKDSPLDIAHQSIQKLFRNYEPEKYPLEELRARNLRIGFDPELPPPTPPRRFFKPAEEIMPEDPSKKTPEHGG